MESVTTADGVNIPMNIQHAIMIQQAASNSEIQKLYSLAQNG